MSLLPPKIEWKTATVIQTVNKIEYRDVVNTVTVEKEVPVYTITEIAVPVGMRQFSSVDELRAWLEQEPYFMPSYDGFDCDDFAKFLQIDAIHDGYQMSTELDWLNGRLHMLNSVIIGNELYFIEPQDHTFWFRAKLD